MDRSPRLVAADGVLVLVTFFWGTSFALMKRVLVTTDPASFLILRFVLAGLMLLPLAWARRRSWSSELIKPGLIAGFFLFGSFITQMWGLVYTSASRSGFITGLNVILVPPLSILVLRRMPARAALLGAGLACGGLYLLTSADQAQGLPFNWGDVLTLMCAFLCAAYILALGKYSPGRDAFWLTFVQFLTVLAGAIVWAALIGELRFELTGEVFLAGLWLAGLCTVFAFWGQTWAQAYTTPTRAAIIFSLEPVFAALFAWWWLDETLGPWGLAGGGLILAGILLAELKPGAWNRSNHLD